MEEEAIDEVAQYCELLFRISILIEMLEQRGHLSEWARKSLTQASAHLQNANGELYVAIENIKEGV
jgi:hypothetical protein